MAEDHILAKVDTFFLIKYITSKKTKYCKIFPNICCFLKSVVYCKKVLLNGLPVFTLSCRGQVNFHARNVVTSFFAWLRHSLSVSCLIEITTKVVSQSLSSLCTPKHLHFNLNMLNSVTWFLFRLVFSSYDCFVQETYTMECPSPISPVLGFMAWVRAEDSLILNPQTMRWKN